MLTNRQTEIPAIASYSMCMGYTEIAPLKSEYIWNWVFRVYLQTGNNAHQHTGTI